MKKCVIWGIGADYDKYVNLIQFQVLKNTLTIEALVSNSKFCNELDGIKVASPLEIDFNKIDYIVICSDIYFDEIKAQAMTFGVKEARIIHVNTFALPCFDFEKYTRLIENPVTIISDDCWGAVVYHYLSLQFSSPFMLCYMDVYNYIKLLENLDYYLNQELEMIKEADLNYSSIPIGRLGNGDKEVHLNFNHSASFTKAKEDWERRKKRINKNNLFIKMTIPNEEIGERFDALPYKNKIGFYDKESKWQSVYTLTEWRWNDDYMRRYYGFSFADYVRRVVDDSKAKPFDILKILVGESGFMRKV